MKPSGESGSGKNSRKRKQKATAKSEPDWTQVEKDLHGLKMLNQMQFELIRNLEKSVRQLKSGLETG